MIPSLKQNTYGFTLVEIIVTLLLMGIIAATVLGRTISTEQTDLTSTMDKVRIHYRYAHSMAMKYRNALYGFRCANDNPREYWIFRLNIPVASCTTEPNLPENQIRLPGENDTRINLSENGVSMDKFTIFFDKYGRPFTCYVNETNNTPLSNPLNISISAGSKVGSLLISPQTGIIQ